MSPERNGEHLLLSHIIPVCSSYFDIGSNKGEWTSYILNNDKNVHTEFHLYEPGIVAYNISSDRFKNIPKVSVYKKAISDTSGSLKFYEQENAGELSSAVEKWAEGPVITHEVEATTIDSEIARLNINYLDYAKIDTEGFDLKALKGAISSIKNNRIGFIQFEYNRVWMMTGSTLLDAYQLLEEHGYNIFLLKPDGLYTYDVRKNGEFYAFSNFLAVSAQNLLHIKPILKGAA